MNNKTDEIKLGSNYEIAKKKEGFILRWEVTQNLIDSISREFPNFDANNLKYITCHLSIWTKIFYQKHRMSTFNRKHSEDHILKNMCNKLQTILDDDECYLNESKHKSTGDKKYNNRYELYEVYFHGDKRIVYRYVISITRNRISIISIHKANK